MIPEVDRNSCDLTLVPLKSWVTISVRGEDQLSYLQSQLTCDIHSVRSGNFVLTSHCNSEGRVVSNLCLYRNDSQITYMLRHDMLSFHLEEMRKYMMFSKVGLSPDGRQLFGLIGDKSRPLLEDLFGSYPDEYRSALHFNGRTVLNYGGVTDRFLLIADGHDDELSRYLLGEATRVMEDVVWLEIDIRSGYPVVNRANSLKFGPFSLNVHTLGGLSFNKGCYLGQEVISRVRFRKINNSRLCYLRVDAAENLKSGDILETKIGGNWVSFGRILSLCRSGGKTHLQVVSKVKSREASEVRTLDDREMCLVVREIRFFDG